MQHVSLLKFQEPPQDLQISNSYISLKATRELDPIHNQIQSIKSIFDRGYINLKLAVILKDPLATNVFMGEPKKRPSALMCTNLIQAINQNRCSEFRL